MDNDGDTIEDEAGCADCGPARGPGLLLTVAGIGALYMGVDLMTGGALTRFVAGVLFRAPLPVPAGGHEHGPASDGDPAAEGVSPDANGSSPG